LLERGLAGHGLGADWRGHTLVAVRGAFLTATPLLFAMVDSYAIEVEKYLLEIARHVNRRAKELDTRREAETD